MSESPKIIYLQGWGGPAVTWCADRIFDADHGDEDTDIEYTRSDLARAAVAAERELAEKSWASMRDEILHGDGTLDNDQTNWVLSIIDDHDLRVSNPESRKRMNTEYAAIRKESS